MLGWRVAISAVLIPALLGIFILDHRFGATAPILLVLALLLTARGSWEIVRLLRFRGMTPSLTFVMFGSMTIVFAGWGAALAGITPDVSVPYAWVLLGPPCMAYALVVLVLMCRNAFLFQQPGQTCHTLGAELFSVSYVGILLVITAQLRWLAGAQAGYLVLSSLVIATKCGDIGGYTVGRLFGRRKLIPRLSPGKTWAGFWGAVATAGLASVAWLHWATPLFGESWQPPAWYWSLLYGVLVGLAGLIGDLCESLIKRDVGQKDSAPLLPGFGGLLDLLDSILFAGPIAFILWTLLPLASWLD